MKAIINADLVMRDHFINDAVLFIEDGKIAGYGEMWNTEIPEGCEIIDAEGEYVGPGLIEIHAHVGGVTIPAWKDPIGAAQGHLDHGVTTYLPTSHGRFSTEENIIMCNNVREAMKKPEGKSIAGIYFEGPYLNPKYGANRALSWVKPIMAEDYEPIIEAAKGLAKVWMLAPEREGALEFVKAAKAAIPELRFAVGHSEATPQQIEALMPYGLCIGTHHTNATGTIVNYPECRGCCVDEAVNYNTNIYAEIISDKRGIHVDPYMQRLVRKIKGDDKIILISDTTYYEAPKPKHGYEGVDDLNFDYEEEIAGSKLTLDVACRNFMKHTGASMVDIFKFASLNAATALGFCDRGQILEGLRADLIIVDRKMNVKKVILEGEVVR